VVVDIAQPELMFAAPEHLAMDEHLSVLAIGPGLGQSERAQALLDKALALRRPVVMDADALNLLAAHREAYGLIKNRAHATLLTPHPGEAARLLGLGVNDVQANRQDAARKIAATFRALVVLKGAGSVVARSDGTVSVNSSGCPAMAAAGMGDVLTGVIAGLIAQGVEPGLALESGVYLHGVAGEQVWEKRKRPPSICASDLLEAIPLLLSTSGS
jgi:hydroxyethylthiazole kinase-like uncharacterized protein yjeF